MAGSTLEKPKQASRTQQPLRVGDLLVERGLVTQEQVEQALSHQRERGHKKLLGEVLIELGSVTEEQVLETIASAVGLPFTRINPKLPDPAALEVLPREFLEKHGVMPLFLVRGALTVAVSEPDNIFLIEEIERLSGYQVQVVVVPANDIAQTLKSYLPDAHVFVIDQMVDDLDADDLAVVDQQAVDLSDLEQAADDSPVIKLVNYLIYSAVKERASDIHVEPGDKALRVRYRVDGGMYVKMKPPHQLAPAMASRVKIMAGMDISERRVPQDGGITVMLNKQPVDLRVSTMPGKFGEKVVMRIVDSGGASIRLAKLGFSPTMESQFNELIHRPNGIVLVTGPTGSGKSTTLYGALNEVTNDSVNICTVEDPVENSVPGVNQFQVNDKAGFTFAKALRALLRQDPDIIMVGEVRDPETAKIATQASLTGHLVLSTLHTNDAPSAVTRLFDIGVEPYLVAATVKGVLAQRLIRRICEACKEPTELSPSAQRWLENQIGSGEALGTVFHGRGCGKCRNTGFAGRVGIMELFIPNQDILEAIGRGASLQEIRSMLDGTGFVTLAQDGIEKVRAGLTTIEEVMKTAAAV